MSDFNSVVYSCIANQPTEVNAKCDVFVIDGAPTGTIVIKTANSAFSAVAGRVYGSPGREMNLISITSTVTENIQITNGFGTIRQPGSGSVPVVIPNPLPVSQAPISDPWNTLLEAFHPESGSNAVLQTDVSAHGLLVNQEKIIGGASINTPVLLNTRTAQGIEITVVTSAGAVFIENQFNPGLGLPIFDRFGNLFSMGGIPAGIAAGTIFYVFTGANIGVQITGAGLEFNIVVMPVWNLPTQGGGDRYFTFAYYGALGAGVNVPILPAPPGGLKIIVRSFIYNLTVASNAGFTVAGAAVGPWGLPQNTLSYRAEPVFRLPPGGALDFKSALAQANSCVYVEYYYGAA